MGCVPTRPSAEPGVEDVDHQWKSDEIGNEKYKKGT
jgi:hypothetical protein